MYPVISTCHHKNSIILIYYIKITAQHALLYSYSCYGNINAVARVIVAMVTYILLLSICCYADICAFAIVNYVDYLIPRKFWVNIYIYMVAKQTCIFGIHPIQNDHANVYKSFIQKPLVQCVVFIKWHYSYIHSYYF